jgi:hypothetical protein
VDAHRQEAIPHRTYFAVVSLGFLIVLLVAEIVVLLGRPDVKFEGDDKLVYLGTFADHSTLYQIGFLIGTLLPVFGLLLTAGVGLLVRPQYWGGETRGTRAMGLIGSLLVLAYVPIAGYAAVTQWTAFPRALEKHFPTADRWDISIAGTLPHRADMLAWGLFGIGAVFIGGRLLRERPPLNWASWALVVCGMSGIAAWLLDVAGVDAASTFSLVSIALLVVFAVCVFLVSQQEAAYDEAGAPAGHEDADASGDAA